MRRAGAMIGLTLVLSACGGGTAKGPATYAQLRPTGAASAVDIWRDPTGRLTFRWAGDNPGDVNRYSPSTLTLIRISGRYEVGRTIFVSSRSAWSHIHAWYGVTKREVTSALATGTASPEPPGEKVGPPKTAKGRYKLITDYETDVGRTATASGLTLPRLKTLNGYPFLDAAKVPGGAALSFGRNPSGNGAITLNIARYDPERPGAMGTIDKQMFDSRRWHHHRGPVPYSVIDEAQVIFPYRSEWIGVTANRGTRWAAIVRAILAAPTH